MLYIFFILFFSIQCSLDSKRAKVSYRKESKSFSKKEESENIEDSQESSSSLDDKNSQSSESWEIFPVDSNDLENIADKKGYNLEEIKNSNFEIYQEREGVNFFWTLSKDVFYANDEAHAIGFTLELLNFCLPKEIFEISVPSGGFVFFSEIQSEIRVNNLPVKDYFQYVQFVNEKDENINPFMLKEKEVKNGVYIKVVSNSCQDRGFLSFGSESKSLPLAQDLSVSNSSEKAGATNTDKKNPIFYNEEDPNELVFRLKIETNINEVSGLHSVLRRSKR